MSVQSADFISDLQEAEELLTKWENWCPALIPAICKIHALKSRAMGK